MVRGRFWRVTAGLTVLIMIFIVVPELLALGIAWATADLPPALYAGGIVMGNAIDGAGSVLFLLALILLYERTKRSAMTDLAKQLREGA